MASGKLLFITSNRLGDAVLSTGLLDAALQRFAPEAVTIACGPIPAPLFEGVPKLERIFVLDKGKGWRHWFDLWRFCASQKWEVVIDLRNSAVSRFISSKKIYRFAHADPKRHKAEQLAAVLSLPRTPANKIWITEPARQKAAQLIPAGARVLALCPTANWPGKQWPAERFIETAERLTGQGGILVGARVAIFAAPNEIPQAQPVIDALSKTHEVINLAGKTDPLEAAACLSRCRFCIANDSGLMHIAAAMRVPTLGLFGPSNDVEYRPWGPHAAFIRGAPFHGLKKTHDPQALMQALSVEDVVASAQKLLA